MQSFKESFLLFNALTGRIMDRTVVKNKKYCRAGILKDAINLIKLKA
jgi:hypothetical protein